jgi:hypothetical protein
MTTTVSAALTLIAAVVEVSPVAVADVTKVIGAA